MANRAACIVSGVLLGLVLPVAQEAETGLKSECSYNPQGRVLNEPFPSAMSHLPKFRTSQNSNES